MYILPPGNHLLSTMHLSYHIFPGKSPVPGSIPEPFLPKPSAFRFITDRCLIHADRRHSLYTCTIRNMHLGSLSSTLALLL